jgi:hypothetical protein
LCRVKRTLPSATTISDRRGPCALNASRAHAATYPAEGHFEDYAPYGEHGGSIASSELRQRTQKERTWTPSAGGNTDLYYTSENEVHGFASLKTPHFTSPEGNSEASPVRKRVRPPYLMYIYYKLLPQDRNKNYETKITTVAASPRPQTKYFCSMSTFHV